MVRVVSGDLPLLVLADAARDIRNAVEFAEAEGVRMVLVSGRDAWKEKALLAEKAIPVLLRATQNVPPQDDDPYHLAFSAATQLHEAGVQFAMTGWGSSGPNPPSRTLAYEAANAVKFGLPEGEALRAITRYPAEILGLGDRLGTIEEGKIGNLVVTDGNPLQIRTQVLHVFVNGHPASLDNRHRTLYERYRARQ
jgi:imidazolonepropionase-like amidohydrolase